LDGISEGGKPERAGKFIVMERLNAQRDGLLAKREIYLSPRFFDGISPTKSGKLRRA